MPIGAPMRSHPEKAGMAWPVVCCSALIPAAALALTGAIGLTPASAGAATWQIASVIGDPAGQIQLSDVAASGPDNAWITGFGCTDSSSSCAVIQDWNGQSWQPFTLPDSSIFGFGT